MRQIKEINQERLLVAKLVFERLAPNRVEYIGKDRTVDGVEKHDLMIETNGGFEPEKFDKAREELKNVDLVIDEVCTTTYGRLQYYINSTR